MDSAMESEVNSNASVSRIPKPPHRLRPPNVEVVVGSRSSHSVKMTKLIYKGKTYNLGIPLDDYKKMLTKSGLLDDPETKRNSEEKVKTEVTEVSEVSETPNLNAASRIMEAVGREAANVGISAADYAEYISKIFC